VERIAWRQIDFWILASVTDIELRQTFRSGNLLDIMLVYAFQQATLKESDDEILPKWKIGLRTQDAISQSEFRRQYIALSRDWQHTRLPQYIFIDRPQQFIVGIEVKTSMLVQVNNSRDIRPHNAFRNRFVDAIIVGKYSANQPFVVIVVPELQVPLRQELLEPLL
jgi:hypothetical protein